MIRIRAYYRVKEGCEAAVEEIVRTFVRAVAQFEPKTEYRAFRLTDSREFNHFMGFPDEAAHQKHQQAAYTLKLVEDLYPVCESEPEFHPLTELN